MKNFLLKKPITLVIDDAGSAYALWHFLNSSSEFTCTGNFAPVSPEDVTLAKDMIMKTHPNPQVKSRPADKLWNQLATQFKANDIDARKPLTPPLPAPIQVDLNNNHIAVVTATGVKVGCQTFTFDKVEELYSAVQQYKQAQKE